MTNQIADSEHVAPPQHSVLELVLHPLHLVGPGLLRREGPDASPEEDNRVGGRVMNHDLTIVRTLL